MEYRQNYRTINFPLKFSTHTCSQVLMCVKFFMELYAYENIIMDRVPGRGQAQVVASSLTGEDDSGLGNATL